MKSFTCTGLLFIVLANVPGMVHGQVCRVGRDVQQYNPSRRQGFYLKTQDPAQCTGTVTQFRYCYYNLPFGIFAASYDFTFAVYRNMGSSYVPVSQAFTTGRTVFNANLGFTGTFACASYTVDEITVEAGDVIGVCIYDPPDDADPVFILGIIHTNRVQLDVVGEDAPSDRFLMSSGVSGCGDSSVPTSVSSLVTQTSRVLHVYADIIPLPSTEQLSTNGTTGQVPTDDLLLSPAGKTAVIVVGILVIIGIAICAVVLIVIAVVKRKNIEVPTNHQRDVQMIGTKPNEAYGAKNKATGETAEAADYDVVTLRGCHVIPTSANKSAEEDIPTDTNAAYHSHATNKTTDHKFVPANSDSIPAGETNMHANGGKRCILQ